MTCGGYTVLADEYDIDQQYRQRARLNESKEPLFAYSAEDTQLLLWTRFFSLNHNHARSSVRRKVARRQVDDCDDAAEWSPSKSEGTA